jgi:adenine phosphoribosyltransferase
VQLAELAASRIVEVPDFPAPGIVFKDLTPLFADPDVFAQVTGWFAEVGRAAGIGDGVGTVVGIESRGFLLGAPAALALGVPFIPVRKAGKLPRAVLEQSYDLEYGTATLAVHADAFPAGGPVLLIDDVLATGGTAAAATSLVRRAGGQVAALAFLLELGFLAGRTQLPDVDTSSLIITP